MARSADTVSREPFRLGSTSIASSPSIYIHEVVLFRDTIEIRSSLATGIFVHISTTQWRVVRLTASVRRTISGETSCPFVTITKDL